MLNHIAEIFDRILPGYKKEEESYLGAVERLAIERGIHPKIEGTVCQIVPFYTKTQMHPQPLILVSRTIYDGIKDSWSIVQSAGGYVFCTQNEPTWKPPKNLPDGVYIVNYDYVTIEEHSFTHEALRLLFPDYNVPLCGKWIVTQNGATYERLRKN